MATTVKIVGGESSKLSLAKDMAEQQANAYIAKLPVGAKLQVTSSLAVNNSTYYVMVTIAVTLLD